MKRRRLISAVVITCVFVVFVGFCAAESKSAKAKPAKAAKPAEAAKAAVTGPSPTITFEKLVHDFGEVSPKSKNTYEFKFKNTGPVVLKIQRPKTSCGCTVAKLDKLDYAPGESGTIKVTYSTGSHGGASSKTIRVPSNDKKNATVKLTVKATVVEKVKYEPKSFRLSLKDKDFGLKPITLEAVDKQAFSIKSFKSRSDLITAEFDLEAKAEKFTLVPKVDIEKLKGLTYGAIDIELTHPDCKKVNIRFNIQKRFTISPPTLTLYDIKPEKSVPKKLWIINNYGEDFEVESTSSRSGHIKVLNHEKVKTTSGGTRYKFDLEITPPASEKPQRFSDELVVKTKGGDELKVQCKGFFKRPKSPSVPRKGSTAQRKRPARPARPAVQQK